MHLWTLVFSLFLFGTTLLAAGGKSPLPIGGASPKGVTPSVDPDLAPTPDPAIIIPQREARTISKKEESTACQKFEGRYISYYGEVFQVVKCQRRPIQSHNAIAALSRQGIKIIPVDSQPIAAIPEGEALSDANSLAKKRSCKELTGFYVTFSFNEIFYVEKCKKRLFPDWASYLSHRSKMGQRQKDILGLTWAEFESIQLGEEFPSSMDQEFAKTRAQDRQVVTIPIKEACKNAEGKILTFHSKMYQIENCKKREIDPEKLTRSRGRTGFRVSEMTPEQWLSLPDGKPMADSR